MKFNLVIFSALLVISQSVFASEYRPGEVIVKFKSGALRTRLESQALYNDVGVRVIHRAAGVEQLILNDDIKVEDAIAALMKNSAVEYAQPNYLLSIQPVIPQSVTPTPDGTPCIIPGIFPEGCGSTPAAPNRPELNNAPAEVIPPVADPDLGQLYGLKNIAATDAWNTFRGDRNFIVADIDTGIDYNHEDLSFNLWRNPQPSDKNDIVGYDFVHDDGLPFDDNGHGTHTAGTIGAVGGNGVGISGVSQRISIMAVKFLSANGQGDTMAAVKAIDYAVTHGAKILNNSWGGPMDSKNNQALLDSVNQAQAAGVLFVAAAGNGNFLGLGVDDDTSGSASYPATYNTDNMIAVAAVDSSDKLAGFSNYGLKTVHLAAPGVDIVSTLPGNQYGKDSGTSMACPHVTGAAALVWAAHPQWNYQQVKKALMDSVDKISSLDGKTVSGGRLNVLNALRTTE